VLVGVDGSEQSRRALAWALAYASGHGAGVEAVMTVPATDDAGETHAMLREAEATLAALVEQAVAVCDDPPSVSYEVVQGEPDVVLVNASRDASLIVLSSHGMSSIRNPVLGSVSTACIRMGSCPVLVIPPGTPEPPDHDAGVTPVTT
jgi:nucleotide-binding universal stress UspA family protein